MARESAAVQIARLEEKVSALTDLVKSLYQEQNELRNNMVEVRHRLGHLQEGLEAIKPTAAEYVKLRERVLGTLGQWAWRAGGVVLAGAGWLAALYTYLTGRPPP
jgi:chromosome segregation ATPase